MSRDRYGVPVNLGVSILPSAASSFARPELYNRFALVVRAQAQGLEMAVTAQSSVPPLQRFRSDRVNTVWLFTEFDSGHRCNRRLQAKKVRQALYRTYTPAFEQERQ